MDATAGVGVGLAAHRGDVVALMDLMHSGASMFDTDAVGVTPLWAAASSGRVSAVRFLARLGGIHAPNADGTTPVEAALTNGHALTAVVLVAHGAVLDGFVASRRDEPGAAVDLAALLCQPCVKSVLQAGAVTCSTPEDVHTVVTLNAVLRTVTASNVEEDNVAAAELSTPVLRDVLHKHMLRTSLNLSMPLVVVGGSATGKSSLVRVLRGVKHPARRVAAPPQVGVTTASFHGVTRTARDGAQLPQCALHTKVFHPQLELLPLQVFSLECTRGGIVVAVVDLHKFQVDPSSADYVGTWLSELAHRQHQCAVAVIGTHLDGVQGGPSVAAALLDKLHAMYTRRGATLVAVLAVSATSHQAIVRKSSTATVKVPASAVLEELLLHGASARFMPVAQWQHRVVEAMCVPDAAMHSIFHSKLLHRFEAFRAAVQHVVGAGSQLSADAVAEFAVYAQRCGVAVLCDFVADAGPASPTATPLSHGRRAARSRPTTVAPPAKCCAKCERNFSTLRRRHECSKCGLAFCASHCRWRVPLATKYETLVCDQTVSARPLTVPLSAFSLCDAAAPKVPAHALPASPRARTQKQTTRPLPCCRQPTRLLVPELVRVSGRRGAGPRRHRLVDAGVPAPPGHEGH